MNTTQKIRSSRGIASPILCLATMLWSLYWPQEVSAQPQLIPVTVLVFNYSDSSASTLKIAEQQAGRIFRDAGLEVSWIWCPVPLTVDSDAACATEIGPTNVRLRIVNYPAGNYFREDIFGFTVAPAVATVYYGHALLVAKSDGADYETPVILGCVMAHEFGHLLLGPGAHTPRGIMQAQWKRDQLERAMKGQVLFTSDEAKQMRSNAASRVAQPTGMAKPDFAALRAAPKQGVTISTH